MPRRYRNRIRRRRKQSWYNRKFSAKDLAIKALRNTKYIRGLVNSEMLHSDRNVLLSPDSSGVVTPCFLISQGDGDSNRTGNSILLRNMLLRLRFLKHPSASTTICRIIIFQDKQQISDTTPAVTNILASASVDAPLNLNASGRFKIMYNKTIVLTISSPLWHKETYRKLYSHVRFNGTASSDIQKNGIYMLVITDQPTNVPDFTFYTRSGYHDN